MKEFKVIISVVVMIICLAVCLVCIKFTNEKANIEKIGFSDIAKQYTEKRLGDKCSMKSSYFAYIGNTYLMNFGNYALGIPNEESSKKLSIDLRKNKLNIGIAGLYWDFKSGKYYTSIYKTGTEENYNDSNDFIIVMSTSKEKVKNTIELIDSCYIKYGEEFVASLLKNSETDK